MRRASPIACLAALLAPVQGFAQIAPAPASAPAALVELVRGEPVGSLLAPRDLAPEDFAVEWAGAAIPEVEVSLEPGSLQWVRVQEVLRLPRARLRIHAVGIGSGQVVSAGFTQPLAPSRDNDGSGVAEVLVPLVSGSANPIRIVIERQGERLEGEVRLRYSPREPAQRPRVYIDTTCSSFGVKVLPEPGAIDDRWAYVGCKMDIARGQGSRTSSLEVLVFWDSVGESIDVDGVVTPSSGASIWRLRASSRPGTIVLRASGQERGGMIVRYAIPERPHKGSLGVGIGPYADGFVVDGEEKVYIEPLVTFYGSYQVSPSSRVVAFNATPLRDQDPYTDTGFYLVRRTSETLDRRLTFNVFLGAHLLFYEAEGEIRSDFSAPQGLEVLFRDAGEPGYNILLGALINPGIGDRSYYNAWLRWGNSKAFIELNYIGWSQTYELQGVQREVMLRSFGLSVGFPLIRFL